jgi:formate hydrogenlyase subunit 3/multisubunit Na+/H+ antiporter MnhD subunit
MSTFAALIGPIGLLALGALASLAVGRSPRAATALGAGSAIAACLAGFAASLASLSGATPAGTWSEPWPVPSGAFVVGVDPLSAFFAVAVYGLGGVAAAYGASYLSEWAGKRNLGAAWCAFDLLLAAMAMVLAARNGVLFLVAWEVMSIAGWALVTFEHDKPEARRGGWAYLVATHAGLAALLVLFLELLEISGGSDNFTELRGAAAPTALLALALFGFGSKAGLVPLHVWLPEAHSAAPSHVSAVMSGVMVKMGIYGILRMIALLGAPPWLGPTLGILGFTGAFLGIALALGERDLKRALAYSTVENVGIVAVGMGLGAWGRATNRPDIAILGFSAALLHAWNHTAMKGLMFLGAGSVARGAKTRDLEKLGGLLGKMPYTGVMLAYGAVALAALPPLNGFASEWLLYRGLAAAGREAAGVAGTACLLGAGFLAFVGALAAGAFARLFGIAFLGQARSDHAANARESGWGMLAAMGVLVALCVAGGLAPGAALRGVEPVVRELVGSPSPIAREAIAPIGSAAALLWLAILLLGWALRRVLAGRPSALAATWSCGYVAPTSRMQYGGAAFSRIAAVGILPRALRSEETVAAQSGLYPEPSELAVRRRDPLLDGAYLPASRAVADRLERLHRLQEGRTWVYIGYIGAALAVALLWSTFGGRP